MTKVVIFFLIGCNLFLTIYVWKYWKQVRELKKWNSSHSQPFVPTHDWKPIPKDQAIPKGLHVRINLKTGEREAKIWDDESNSDSNVERTSILVSELSEDPPAVKKMKMSKLGDVGKLVIDVNMNDHEGNNTVPDTLQKFRSYDELKKELHDLNLQMKTDMEVLQELFEKINKYKQDGGFSWCFQESDTEISILNDLETLLHQVDNAEDFAKRNGIIDVLLPCLNSNSTVLQVKSARVLAAATQNNARVQISVLKSGALTSLLKIVALNPDTEARSSAISSISCVVRSFPLAQSMFLKEGGINALLTVFAKNSADDFKLQMKVVSLFYDLLSEQKDVDVSVEEHLHDRNVSGAKAEELKTLFEKQKQYSTVNIKRVLTEHGWCSSLGNLMANKVVPKNFVIGTHVDEPKLDHDVVDKIVNALLPLIQECKETFKKEPMFFSTLETLLRYYKILSAQDEFFTGMYNDLHTLDTKMRDL